MAGFGLAGQLVNSVGWFLFVWSGWLLSFCGRLGFQPVAWPCWLVVIVLVYLVMLLACWLALLGLSIWMVTWATGLYRMLDWA
jgi:hypothetical protein